jgi:ketosteroid isomerase-like protein
MCKVLVTSILLCLLTPLTFGQAASKVSKPTGKAEAAVRKQLENWLDALKRGDMAALNRIIADDFMIIGAEGTVRSKDEDLAPIKSGALKFESLTTEGVRVFVYGDTAVVTGIGIYKGNFKGRAVNIRERFFDVYQRRKGQWKVVASRSTPGEKG